MCQSTSKAVRIHVQVQPSEITALKPEIKPASQIQRVPSILDISEIRINIVSGVGTGKTFREEEFIGENTGMSAIYITCRISMAKYIHGRMTYLGFGIYSEVTNDFRFVQEYESLYKVKQTVDVVVLDEIRSSLMSATTYETNRLNLCNDFRTLVTLCKESNNSLMDADSNLDGATVAFIHSVFPTHGISLRDYFPVT